MKIEDFVNKIESVDGLHEFVLVRRDGHIEAHNLDNPDSFASLVVFNGLSSDTVKSIMKHQGFRYLMVSKDRQNVVFIFRLGNYYLGTTHTQGVYSQRFRMAIYDHVQKALEGKGPSFVHI